MADFIAGSTRVPAAVWYASVAILAIPLCQLPLDALAAEEAIVSSGSSRPASSTPAIVFTAKQCKGGQARIYRDDRSADKHCAVVLFKEDNASYTLCAVARDLPAGDYILTAWLEAQPLPIQHGLSATIHANAVSRRVSQIDFDGTFGLIPGSRTPVSGAGYQPFSLAFTHRGGPAAMSIVASSSELTDGMKRVNTIEEKEAVLRPIPIDDLGLEDDATPGVSDGVSAAGGGVIELDEDASIETLSHLEKRLSLDRIEIVSLRSAASVIAEVSVDKVHYVPNETVTAVARLEAGPSGGAYTLLADDITEIDAARRVLSREITLRPRQKLDVTFEYSLDNGPEFGHELRCSLVDAGREIHSNREYFGCSQNVYRIGITGGDAVGQDKSKAEIKSMRAGMERNKAMYANHFEQFSWAPCTFSDMTPKTEGWYSGQTQYRGTKTGYTMMIDEAHRVGVKVLTYGHAGGGGIAGLANYLKHPEIFATGNDGFGLYNTFLAERAFYDEYAFPDVPGTQRWLFWLPVWSGSGIEAAEWSAKEINGSINMFGWDGVRWDQPVDHESLIREKVLASHPNCIFGFNVCFARPVGETFLPPKKDTTYFHRLASHHSMMMDESVRGYGGDIKPYYAALASEADYIKRIGGLPLIITFDQATKQDGSLDGRIALAAGQRYTYNTSCGDFAFGSSPKFLTRFSAFVWDDTARIADAAGVVDVKVGRGPKDATPWFDRTIWLRKLPNGHQQLLVNILNPPGYTKFKVRIQPPPATLYDVGVSVPTPAGATLVRTVHISPDLIEGVVPLEATSSGDKMGVTLPQLRSWSIVVFEYGPAAGTLAYPAFPLTTPLEDAQAEFARIEQNKEAKDEAAALELAARVDAGLAQPTLQRDAKPTWLDFSHTINIDATAAQKLVRPEGPSVLRNGTLDVFHANGVFAWLNPVENAMGLAGGGNYGTGWVSSHYWHSQPDGATHGFPETLEELLARDVVVLSNMHATALGPRRRAMLNEYVKAGGGLIFFSGCDSLSMGADHNTSLAELLPVAITSRLDLERNDKGLPLRPASTTFFPKGIRWDTSPQAYCVDVSPLKPGVEVLATAAEFPAIVSQSVGKGRVITVLANHFGNPAEQSLPYWKWNDWPRVIATCMVATAGEYKKVDPPRIRKRALNPKEVNPETLEIESAVMEAKEFTEQLKSAQKNMVDADMARALMATVVDNADNVEDLKIFAEISEAAAPYLDASFAPLARKLSASPHAALRMIGYKVIGLSGDTTCQGLLTAALKATDDVNMQRAILISLGQLGAGESIPAVRRYLNKGSEKLLAWAALKRMGDERAVPESIALYAYSTRAILGFQSSYWGQYETNTRIGYRMTPARARAASAQLNSTVKARDRLIFDLQYYVNSLDALTESEIGAIGDFLRSTESRTVAPLAYTLCGRLPKDRAEAFCQRLVDAKLPQLRALAE